MNRSDKEIRNHAIKSETEALINSWAYGMMSLSDAAGAIWEVNKMLPYLRYSDVKDVDGHWYEAIHQALPDFDPSYGIQFTTFAFRRFRHYIRMVLMRNSCIIVTPKDDMHNPHDVIRLDDIRQ